MEVLFVGVGLALVVAALAAKDVSLGGSSIPAFTSVPSRLVASVLGALLVVVGLIMADIIDPGPPGPSPAPSQAGASMSVSPSASADPSSDGSPVASDSPGPIPPTDAPVTPEPPAPPSDGPTPAASIVAGPWRGMPAPFNSGIDAALTRDGPRMYLFKDSQYVRFTDLTSGKEAGPTVTSGNFKGMTASFSAGIDAATEGPVGQIYFFKGDQYIRFSDLTVGADSNPIQISGNWRGMPAAFNAGIDAALMDQAGRIYFFKGVEYVRFTTISDGMDTGYPKTIASRWAGMPESFDAGVDAAMATEDGAVYFFRGDQYVRFSAGQGTVDSGYPMKIGG